MSNPPDRLDEEDLSRKRPWLAEQFDKDVSPSKRLKKNEKSKGISGFLRNPFAAFYGMLYGDDRKEKKDGRTDASNRNEDDVRVTGLTPRKVDNTASITFLNEDSPQERRERRAKAGSEEVQIEKHIQRDVLVSDDSEDDEIQQVSTVQKTPVKVDKSFEKQDEEVQEIPASVDQKTPGKMEKSFEKQEDGDLDVIFQHVIATPNRHLQEATRLQNEVIFLNDNPDVLDDEISVTSDTRSQGFVSPTPDDSVSRPRTPVDYSSSLSNYSTKNIRDYWTRSKKKPLATKRPPVRQSLHHPTPVHRIGTSSVQKSKTKPRLSARDHLIKGILAAGQYEGVEFSALTETKNKKTLNSDVLTRTRNKIAEIQASRGNTPSISRESSVIFEGTSQRRHQTPSTSASIVSTESYTRSQQRFNDIISQIDRIKIQSSSHRGPHGYELAYDDARNKAGVLEAEGRIRQDYRIQTKGDVEEIARKNLAYHGIVIRPRVQKKVVVDDFLELPESADRLIEKAWSNRYDPEQQFVDAFSIPITRKDLVTLSGLQWLNDNVINFYLQLICDRSVKDSNYPKTYAFNTFFYTNIITKGYASVKRWTRKVDIFSYEIVLVPVHLGMHWCMAVVDMVQQKIEFYDSLYDGNTAVLPALKSYIQSESMDKKKTAFDFTGWDIYQMEDIPRQQNGSDCGVFSCQFGEWASRRTTPRFTQKNMPYYRKRMVYEIVSQKLLATI